MKTNQEKPLDAKKEPAEFNLVIIYTYNAARKKGRDKQTHRCDLTALNYESSGMDITDLHPLEILFRKYLEEKLITYRATMYNNRPGTKQPVVFDVIIYQGTERWYCNRLNEFYDMSTGKSWKKVTQDQLEQKTA